jgi:hypothetical protein
VSSLILPSSVVLLTKATSRGFSPRARVTVQDGGAASIVSNPAAGIGSATFERPPKGGGLRDAAICLQLGHKRKSRGPPVRSQFDPNRSSTGPFCCDANHRRTPVLQEGRERENIRPCSEFIWEIPVRAIGNRSTHNEKAYRQTRNRGLFTQRRSFGCHLYAQI